jgi:CBS domain-containing protein
MICPACQTENIAGSDNCAECQTDLRDLDVSVATTPLDKSLTTDPISGLIPADPLQVSPSTPVREVLQNLVDSGRNCALIVENGAMRGLLTERDILMRIAHRYDQVADQPVSDFMTPNPERLRPTDTIAYGLNRMVVGKYRHLPIEDDGKALGVVSVRHVLGFLAQQFPEVLAEVG